MICPYDLGIKPATSIVIHNTYKLTDVKRPTFKKFTDYMKLVNDYKNNVLHKDVAYELNLDGKNYTLYIQRENDNEGIYFTVRKSS